ncbi:hypothetical protein [Thiomicrorhabdus sp.]|uniref:hypothetical protein n=1 Tax=Thiomicrorhabdus sp. TaxID=2039724 RepID=UPI0029C88CCC|nr:hypothetical protein [Thiomicrorhabdus sp.]
MFEKQSNDYIVEFTPLEKAEALFDELVEWYGDAEKKELRAAAKLLIVSLEKFSIHGGHQWHSLVMEYVNTLKFEPEKFQKIIESNRGELKNKTSDLIQ